jgi:hypothetical protein
MRMFVVAAFTVLVALTFVTNDANAIVYCKNVGVPKGCVVPRPAPGAVVVTPGVGGGTPGVGVGAAGAGVSRAGNRGSPVDRAGRR